METVELLAPVGKIENAYAAIENGADAIFIGGKLFNARQYADNFSHEELEEIVRYAKLRAVKVYITVNTLVKEEEINELFSYLEYLSDLGIDAIISQDLGVARLVKSYFPHIALHASTQMTAHSLADVLFLKELGFKRIVLARELNINEIKEIAVNCDVEIETFVHGALCYSYSGQCLMSSLIGGRSGNRGRCAQPCRMKYQLVKDGRPVQEEGYLLSLKDMCSLDFMEELIASGIYSFKIEGRMKSPEYVASVVGIYRKAIDRVQNGKGYKASEEDLEVLKGVFNRGGFSKGYYYETANKAMVTENSPKHIGIQIGTVIQFSPKMNRATILLEGELNPGDGIEIIRSGRESVGAGISKHYEKGMKIYLDFDKYVEVGSKVYLTKNHLLLKNLRGTYAKANRKIPVDLKITSKVGEPIQFVMRYKELGIHYTGEILEKASNAPILREQAVKQLTKFGNTAFELNKLELDWDETGYIAISKLNEMRRNVLSLMEEKILIVPKQSKANYSAPQNVKEEKNEPWIVQVSNMEQLKVCLERPEISAVYWEWQYQHELSREAYARCEEAGKNFYLALPHIMRNKLKESFCEELDYWEKTAAAGYLVRTCGQYKNLGFSLKHKNIDYNLNIMNNEAIALWQAIGASRITVSAETADTELQKLQGNLERIVYGHIPVMTTEQCLLKHYDHCKKKNHQSSIFQLKDRKGIFWPIQTDCTACVMQVLTDKPIAVKHLEDIKYRNISSLRLNFSYESKEETKKILEAYFSKDGSEMNAIQGTAFKFIE